MENQVEKEMTAEELEARKEEMRKFYEESIPYLEAQCKHEEFLAKIAEARYKRMHYDIQFAMMMQGPQDENEGPEEQKEAPAKGRKLKRE
jgi:hypothetical protein